MPSRDDARVWLLALTSVLWVACSGATGPAEAPASTPTASDASAQYSRLVIDDWRVLERAHGPVRDGCPQVSDAGCDDKLAVERTAAQRFLDDLVPIAAPTRLRTPHAQLVSELQEFVSAIDAARSAIAAHNGDAYYEATFRRVHAYMAISGSTYEVAPSR